MEEVFLEQTAVLWPVVGFSRYGQPLVGSPVEVACRWNTNRREAVDSKGRPVTIDGQVVVADDVEVGSRMVLGELQEFLGTGSALPDNGVSEVLAFSDTPDIRNRAKFRTLTVGRYHSSV